MLPWQKMKSSIVNWASLITHLTRWKFGGKEGKPNRGEEEKRREEKRREEKRTSRSDEPLSVWLVKLVEVKLTAIDRPGRPRLLLTSNQP